VTVLRDDPALRRWARRTVTFSTYAFLLASAWLWAPPLFGIALVVDLVADRRLPRARLVAYAPVYLALEIGGLVAAFAIWIACGTWAGAGRDRFLDWNFRLQCLWARALLGAARTLMSFEIEVEDDELAGDSAPALVFVRHASLVDTLLPAVLLSARHGLRLRWVMKRELLIDPCLDVVGQRLPNAFVRRGSGQAEREIAVIERLGEDLGRSDGVCIFPEGTRFTEAKRKRALERIRTGGDLERLERVRPLAHVLPVRLGGPRALMRAAPDADVLMMGHVGFEGLATLRDVLGGHLVGRTVRVRFWRTSASALPRDDAARTVWLDAQWERIDRWLGETRGEPR